MLLLEAHAVSHKHITSNRQCPIALWFEYRSGKTLETPRLHPSFVGVLGPSDKLFCTAFCALRETDISGLEQNCIYWLHTTLRPTSPIRVYSLTLLLSSRYAFLSLFKSSLGFVAMWPACSLDVKKEFDGVCVATAA